MPPMININHFYLLLVLFSVPGIDIEGVDIGVSDQTTPVHDIIYANFPESYDRRLPRAKTIKLQNWNR